MASERAAVVDGHAPQPFMTATRIWTPRCSDGAWIRQPLIDANDSDPALGKLTLRSACGGLSSTRSWMHVSTLAGYMAALSGSSGVFTCAVVVDKTPRIVGRCDRVTGNHLRPVVCRDWRQGRALPG